MRTARAWVAAALLLSACSGSGEEGGGVAAGGRNTGPGARGIQPPMVGPGPMPLPMPPGHPPIETPPGHGKATGAVPNSGRFRAPDGWEATTPGSKMRLAQFRLPRADGDAADGEVAVFHFLGGGGGTRANIDRWKGQFAEKDSEKEEEMTEGLEGKVTLVDVTGRYTAEMSPGSGKLADQAGARMIAAVIEVPDGPYFVKATGPRGTLGKWETSIREFIRAAAKKP